MTDIWRQLQIARFRGIALPITRWSMSHSHELVEHAFQYKTGEIVETTAGKNWRFRYTIASREDLIVSPYEQWFTTQYPLFLKAYRDPSPGELIDPIFGELRAKPVAFSGEGDPTRRDGIDIETEFVEAPSLDSLDEPANESTLNGIITASRELDTIVAKVKWRRDGPEQVSAKKVDWTQSEPPPATVNPIDFAAGVIRSAQHGVDRTSAIFTDTAGRLSNLEDAVNDSKDPELFPLIRVARDLRLQVLKAQARQESRARPLRVTRLPNAMTPLDAASLVRLDLAEFQRLNRGLAKQSLLEADTLVTHYKR